MEGSKGYSHKTRNMAGAWARIYCNSWLYINSKNSPETSCSQDLPDLFTVHASEHIPMYTGPVYFYISKIYTKLQKNKLFQHQGLGMGKLKPWAEISAWCKAWKLLLFIIRTVSCDLSKAKRSTYSSCLFCLKREAYLYDGKNSPNHHS